MFRTIKRKLEKKMRAKTARKELRSLTDRQLNDMGISRSDIDFIEL